ncbi:MAG: cysteine desulfurase [Clostridia bacterium]|nr:cysteine desulfurase [Clostridia bacterium]
MIYLDNSATTQVCAAAVQAAVTCMTEGFYNPSALYMPSMAVEKDMNACRDAILRAVDAGGDARVVFTSGGTEADNLAILGGTEHIRDGKVLYSAGEHPAVREACEHLKALTAEEIPLAADGRVRLDRLEAMLTPDTRLICVMQVNNETGAVMPITEIAKLRDRLCPEAVLHVDGVQGFLRVPFSMRQTGADSYALSGHKIHAPKGIGALVYRPRLRLNPRQIGGGQEKALRSGTENTPGIAALRAAIAAWPKDADIRALKCLLFESLKSAIPDAVYNGPDPASGDSAPHILNVSLPPVRSETMLYALAGDGVYVGIGSACSSHKQKVSRVLRAMGLSGPRAESALRFSLCPFNTEAEMRTAAEIAAKHYEMLKKYTRR